MDTNIQYTLLETSPPNSRMDNQASSTLEKETFTVLESQTDWDSIQIESQNHNPDENSYLKDYDSDTLCDNIAATNVFMPMSGLDSKFDSPQCNSPFEACNTHDIFNMSNCSEECNVDENLADEWSSDISGCEDLGDDICDEFQFYFAANDKDEDIGQYSVTRSASDIALNEKWKKTGKKRFDDCQENEENEEDEEIDIENCENIENVKENKKKSAKSSKGGAKRLVKTPKRGLKTPKGLKAKYSKIIKKTPKSALKKIRHFASPSQMVQQQYTPQQKLEMAQHIHNTGKTAADTARYFQMKWGRPVYNGAVARAYDKYRLMKKIYGREPDIALMNASTNSNKYSDEDRVAIAEYCVAHGPVETARVFSERLGFIINESSVRGITKRAKGKLFS